MTENLLQKLEEKMMMLLTEVEELRHQVQHLKSENVALKNEKERQSMEMVNNESKLQDLLSLLDAINVVETPMSATMEEKNDESEQAA